MAIKPFQNLPEHAMDHAALKIRRDAYIPEKDTDPTSPIAGDTWVKSTGLSAEDNPGHIRILGILTMTYSSGGGNVYDLSYKTADGGNKIVRLS